MVSESLMRFSQPHFSAISISLPFSYSCLIASFTFAVSSLPFLKPTA